MRIVPAAFLALAALCASLLAVPVAAQNDAGDAYEGRAAVADQSAASRDPALREALAQVIARVSGPGATASAGPVIARAGQYVQRYGYSQDPGGALQLLASFDKAAIDSQLRALGLPVWGYSSAPAEDLTLSVAGLRSSADYARVITALRAAPGVKSVAVQGADADRLQLAVRAEGGAARLGSALAGGRVLIADTTSAPQAGALKLRLVQ
jgi:hypothetical protein